MKKIITFICILVFCVGLNSCAIYTTDDDYGYRSGSCYHTHSIYYRPAHYPTRHYSRPKPKPYYRRPKPKPTHHPHSHRPHNSRDNHNNHNHNKR